MLPQKPNRNVAIGTNIAHGVRMMPELFVFPKYLSLSPKFAKMYNYLI